MENEHGARGCNGGGRGAVMKSEHDELHHVVLGTCRKRKEEKATADLRTLHHKRSLQQHTGLAAN